MLFFNDKCTSFQNALTWFLIHIKCRARIHLYDLILSSEFILGKIKPFVNILNKAL